ncbi:hypothetical protein BH23CHL2_BH23CHL2_19480 [soil metagenome]
MSRGVERNQSQIQSHGAPLLSAFRMLAILSAAFLIWSTARLELWETSSPETDAASSSIPWTKVNPIGVNTFLAREVESWKRERTLEMASEAGAGWIKEHFPWRDIETAPDTYWDNNFQQDSWAKYDAIVEAAERHGLRVIARIDLPPGWARPTGSDHTSPPANLDDFADFVTDFVDHFRGRVQFIQIWNEPNLAAEWGGEIDPEGYAELLRVAATAARQADPNVVILSAPLAMTTENSDRAMDDLSYWRALYKAGAEPHFDIMSANAYGLDQKYDAAPDARTLNIRRIELIRQIAVEHGDGDKPIWLNEYGWNASPEGFSPEILTWSRVTEDRQAEWTADGIEYLTGEHPWFGVANTWYFRQVGDISIERPDYYFRAVDVEFTPRPLYHALNELGDRLRYARPGVHNDLDAGIRPVGIWSIVRDPGAIQQEYISGSTGSRLIIQIEGNRLVGLLSEHQRGTTIVVSTADGSGTGGEELAIADGQQRIELASWSVDQAPRARTVSVEVVGPQPLLLDGIEVRDGRSSRTLIVGGSALVLAVACLAILRRNPTA